MRLDLSLQTLRAQYLDGSLSPLALVEKLHKQMLALSRRFHALKDAAPPEQREAALEHLLAARHEVRAKTRRRL